MGPESRYNDEPIPDNPKIRRFIWEYAHTLYEILATFIIAGCTAAGKKLVIATPVVHIVGNLCSLEGRRPHHGIITKILNWPTPTNLTGVRGFLGTAGVARRWVKNFASIAKPLTILTKGTNAEFRWSQEAQQAMEILKQAATEVPALKALDIEKAKNMVPQGPNQYAIGQVIVAVDSSYIAVGYILSQQFEDGHHPILFGSITWNDTESRYSQAKLELYGLYCAMRALRYMLWGIKVLVEVDALYLKQMINHPDLPNAAVNRWISYLQLFNIELKHIPGLSHTAADGLSRRECAPEDSENSSEELEPDEGGHFITGPKPADLALVKVDFDQEEIEYIRLH